MVVTMTIASKLPMHITTQASKSSPNLLKEISMASASESLVSGICKLEQNISNISIFSSCCNG